MPIGCLLVDVGSLKNYVFSPGWPGDLQSNR